MTLWSQLAGGLRVKWLVQCPGESVMTRSRIVGLVAVIRVGSFINWNKLLPLRKWSRSVPALVLDCSSGQKWALIINYNYKLFFKLSAEVKSPLTWILLLTLANQASLTRLSCNFSSKVKESGPKFVQHFLKFEFENNNKCPAFLCIIHEDLVHFSYEQWDLKWTHFL